MNATRIIQFNARIEGRLDEVLFDRRREEDHTGRDIAIGTAAAGAAAGGGYLGHKKIMDTYGQRIVRGKKVNVGVKDAYAAAGADMKRAAKDTIDTGRAKARDIGTAIGDRAGAVNKSVRGAVKGAERTVRKTVRGLKRRAIKFLR